MFKITCRTVGQQTGLFYWKTGRYSEEPNWPMKLMHEQKALTQTYAWGTQGKSVQPV